VGDDIEDGTAFDHVGVCISMGGARVRQ